MLLPGEWRPESQSKPSKQRLRFPGLSHLAFGNVVPLEA